MGNKYELRIDPAMFLDQLEIDFNDVNYYDTTIDEDFFIEMIEAGSIIRNRLAKQDKEPRSFIGRIGEFLYKWHENIGKVEYSFSLEKTMTGEYKNAILKISSLDPSIVSYEILDNLHSSFSMSGSLGDPDAYSLLLGLNRLNTITNILPSPYKSNNIQTVITKSLTTSYNKRSDMMWMKYVHSIVSIVENTPKNIGIFTPSYTILKKIMDSGLENKISKPIYEIKRGMSSDDNDKIVSKFKNEADNNGAVLISVLGGRSSEGADFPGEYMQSVIVIGIPYAPPSVQTQSQIEYLESKFPKKGRALAYQIPAINRASQAAGRPVRSLNDVAFIMLGDERFSQKNVFEQLPGWIRDSVERIDYNPNELGKRVDDFYKNL
jgi:DNA excision repair protein ERCC-2